MMKTTMKKRLPRRAATSASPPATSSNVIATEQEICALSADIEEPLLTPEQVKFHLSLTAENGFSMEAALERLAKKKAATSTRQDTPDEDPSFQRSSSSHRLSEPLALFLPSSPPARRRNDAGRARNALGTDPPT